MSLKLHHQVNLFMYNGIIFMGFEYRRIAYDEDARRGINEVENNLIQRGQKSMAHDVLKPTL